MSSLLGISFVILGVTYFPIAEYIFSTSLFSLIGELFAIFQRKKHRDNTGIKGCYRTEIRKT